MSRNDKLSTLKIQAYTNFLILIEKLLALVIKESYDLVKIQLFESELANTSPLVLRSWLEEKLLELKNAASD